MYAIPAFDSPDNRPRSPKWHGLDDISPSGAPSKNGLPRPFRLLADADLIEMDRLLRRLLEHHPTAPQAVDFARNLHDTTVELLIRAEEDGPCVTT